MWSFMQLQIFIRSTLGQEKIKQNSCDSWPKKISRMHCTQNISIVFRCSINCLSRPDEGESWKQIPTWNKSSIGILLVRAAFGWAVEKTWKTTADDKTSGQKLKRCAENTKCSRKFACRSMCFFLSLEKTQKPWKGLCHGRVHSHME